MAPMALFFTLASIIISTFNIETAATSPNFTAILVFGDSTVDTGNNNYFPIKFRSNHLPYGKDFPGQIPTGRFSDGKLIPDFIASLLGIKEAVPPFLDPGLSDDEIRTGVSFASAGSGFDFLTTATSGAIPVTKQIDSFSNYITKLKGIAGEEAASTIIAGALIFISAGTHDFAFNYYDIPIRSHQFNMSGYQDFLLGILQSFVKGVYGLGGRSMLIAGLPPIGCLPIQITRSDHPTDRRCLKDQNSDSQSYNLKLEILLPQFQASFPGSRFAYLNLYHHLSDMVIHPQRYGFIETNRGCCGTGLTEAGQDCNLTLTTCGNPAQFLFWDCIHPSESAYKALFPLLEKDVISGLLPV